MAKDWKDRYPYRVQQVMKNIGWGRHLFQYTAAGLVQTLDDDELDALDEYLDEMDATNIWWAEYDSKEPMLMAVQDERRRRILENEEKPEGKPVIFARDA